MIEPAGKGGRMDFGGARLSRRDLLGRALQLSGGVAAGGWILSACATSDGTDDSESPSGGSVSPGGSSIEGVTLDNWSQAFGVPGDFKAFVNDSVADFKSTTGAEVQWEIIPWASALQKWDLSMSNGDLPDVADVFYLQSRVVQGRGEWGPLDITDLVSNGFLGDWERFPLIAQRESEYEGRIYGIPWYIDSRGFVYNETLWPEAPETLEDFEAIARSVGSSSGVAPSATFGLPGHSLSQVGATWGVEPLSDDNRESNFSDPRWEEALDWAQRMVNEGIFLADTVTSPEVAATYDPWLNGTVASMFGGASSVLPVAEGQSPKLASSLRSALMPVGPGMTTPFSIASVEHWSVFQNSEVRDASLEWLKYLTSSDVNEQLVIAAGQDSPDLVVQERLSNEWTAAFFESSKNATYIDAPSPAWAELSATEGPVNRLAIAVWSGEEVAGALQTAHEDTNQILAKYE